MPIVGMPDGTQVQFPDNMPPDQIRGLIAQKFPDAATQAAPQVSVASDVAKSAPTALVKGLGGVGDLREIAKSGADYIGIPQGVQHAIGSVVGATKLGRVLTQSPTSAQTKGLAESVAGPMYEAQTPIGRVSESALESLTNPVNYAGAGTIPFKAMAAALSGAGSGIGGEVAGTPGRIVGGLAGGAAAVKTMGVKPVEAAIPNSKELQMAARTGDQYGGYTGALMSGLELDPAQVAPVAYGIEQKLNAKGFTGGPNGTAPGTLSDIQSLQSPPAGSTITAANLDTLLSTLRQRMGAVATDARGVTRPTPDAVAARHAAEDLKAYTDAIPQSHVVAGDAQAYRLAKQEADANYAAAMRTQSAEQRINTANLRYERKPNTTLGSQLKNQFGPMLEKDYRTAGFTQEEKAQLGNINSAGGKVIDTLGSRSIPAMTVHALLGVPSLGMSLPASVIANYGARKLGSALTAQEAKKLKEMLAKRSPEYQSRVANLPQVDYSPNQAAIARALLSQASQ